MSESERLTREINKVLADRYPVRIRIVKWCGSETARPKPRLDFAIAA